MLSSGNGSISNNENPFHQIPSFFSDNNDGNFVHQDLTTQDQYFFPNNVAVGNAAEFPPLDDFDRDILMHDQKNNIVALEGNVPLIFDPLLISLLRPRWKKPDAVINKHRHRKIVTAQGSRDRRVRLSIQIARRFFDLQDILGFDKASETIDWLLTQSKPAIEEIVKIKQRHCTVAAELEKDIEAAEIGDSFKRNSSVSSNSTGSGAKEIGITMQQQHSDYLAKELRAKARERARERTKAKMTAKRIIELQNFGFNFGPIIPNSWNHFNKSREMRHSIAESILTRNKLNAPQHFTANQQMFTSSRQVSSSSTTIAENNWRISNNFSTRAHQQQAMGATCTTEDTAYIKNKI